MGRYIQQPVRSFNPGITDTKDFYGSGQYRIFSSSGTWTVPTGVSSVRVTALGAGGGGGGHWLAQQDGGTCLGGFCTAHFRGSFSLGGNGGGGAYTVGLASVTPGCVCCVVVGAGGTTADTCYKWLRCGSSDSHCCCAGGDTTKLCACCGTDGGFSCALGICAPGGKGGGMGRCGWGGLDVNIWCVRTNYATYCQCIDCGCSGCICGGAGGSGGNGFVSYCGGAGDQGCWQQCGSNTLVWCVRQFGNAGAAGSPLGHGNGAVIPNLLNSAAFDGSTDNDTTLILKYDLPYPRWCGQVIYTQATGTLGAPGNGTVTCGCSCTGAQYSYCCVAVKSKWNAPCAGSKCCVACDPGGGTYCLCCSSCQVSCGGLGSGAIAYYMAGMPYDIGGSGACCCCRLNTCSGPGSTAGAGEVILEW